MGTCELCLVVALGQHVHESNVVSDSPHALHVWIASLGKGKTFFVTYEHSVELNVLAFAVYNLGPTVCLEHVLDFCIAHRAHQAVDEVSAVSPASFARLLIALDGGFD